MPVLAESLHQRASRADGVCRRCSVALCLLLAATAWGCQRIPTADYSDGEDGLGSDEPDPQPEGNLDPVYNCDPVDQNDCGPGQKCTPLNKYGKQNFYECVDDDGENDTFEGCLPDSESGRDGCRAGSVCLADATESGICVNLCLKDSECEAGLCVEDPLMDVFYCADECVPFTATGCPDVLECRRANDRTACQFWVEIDDGIAGEECAARIGDRGCREGFACLAGSVVTGCASLRCCAQFCDLRGSGTECVEPDTCNPAFDDAAPAAENVGACYVPA